MAKSRYQETEHFQDSISPTSFFNGKEVVRIKDTKTGKVTTGRGNTYESARDRAITKQIESGKRK